MKHIVAGTFIEKDGKYLLVKENKGKIKGKWNIPAGSVDEGEFIEEAAIRETFEETGYKVEILDIGCIYNKVLNDNPIVGIVFHARIIGGEIKYDKEEISEVKWVTEEELMEIKDNLRIKLPILRCLENLKNNNFIPLDTIIKIREKL